MAQMAPQYSQEHWQATDEEIYRDVAPRIASLIDETLPDAILYRYSTLALCSTNSESRCRRS